MPATATIVIIIKFLKFVARQTRHSFIFQLLTMFGKCY